jgi:hypothetical protein
MRNGLMISVTGLAAFTLATVAWAQQPASRIAPAADSTKLPQLTLERFRIGVNREGVTHLQMGVSSRPSAGEARAQSRDPPIRQTQVPGRSRIAATLSRLPG